MKNIRTYVENVGLPRIIIVLLLLTLFTLAPAAKVRIDTSLSDIIKRFSMNSTLALAMVPMVQSGCGLNFGLPLGIVAGLLGSTIVMNFELTGFLGFGCAMILTILFGMVLGGGYGALLNRVKGSEMTIALYVGFSSVAFMSLWWLLLPYKNPVMIWGYGGEGLRTTITTEGYWLNILDNLWAIKLGEHFTFPTGSLLFIAFLCFLVWAFFHTKTGTAVTAVGSNPEFARASGINIDTMRLKSVMMSTVLGGIGILLYQQSYGFIQLYMGPLYMSFPAVAAVLIGGASIHKATILNVVVGTLLYQGIVAMTPSVINSLIQSDISDVIRIISTHGIILYALTMTIATKKKGKK
ncbi:ABC transporter [candidate division KSB3 bacterium]|uniref:ABC transporter n=1 Tax=candidate division KSB3 bacterium TaxID=2044937 RepID=A0A2G6E447_9BACT|nr:MAG: ABC transporter [candidate division KSB3 bacterium]PIE29067.1 MAG: ABC transporter [candidate division KSB3 bacterium]